MCVCVCVYNSFEFHSLCILSHKSWIYLRKAFQLTCCYFLSLDFNHFYYSIALVLSHVSNSLNDHSRSMILDIKTLYRYVVYRFDEFKMLHWLYYWVRAQCSIFFLLFSFFIWCNDVRLGLCYKTIKMILFVNSESTNDFWYQING